MFDSFRFLTGVVVVCALSCSNARAETLVFVDDGPGFVSHFYFDRPQLGNLTFPLFDPSLGVLNSVTLSVTGALQASTNLFCAQLNGCSVEAPNQPGTVTTEVAISVESMLGPLNAVLDPMSPVLRVGVSATVPAQSAFTLYLGPALLELQVVDIDLPVEHFIQNGGGTFSLTCSGVGSRSSIGSFSASDVQAENLVSTACGASLTYDYTAAEAVPEPGSLLLWAAGLVALRVTGRKREQA